jgi:PAS domain S-box-containing protein
MPDHRTRAIDHRRAFARFTAWVCLVAPAAVMALILLQQGQLYRLTGPTAFVLSGGLALWLLRRNRNAAAFGVLSYGSWLATVIALSYSGGLYGNSALALPIVILFSVWLAGIRAMLLLGGATIAILFGYAFLEMYGLLPVRAVTPILQRAFIMSVIVLTATALGYFAARTLADQMAALAAARDELEGKMAALARRERELSLMTEHVPAMIAHYDRDRNCRFANSAYAGFVGKTPESILGRKAEDIIGTTAYADIESAIARVLGGEAVRLTTSRINTAGDRRSLALELVPDAGGSGVDGWYALIRDVTERERAAKSLRHIIDGTARATGAAFFRALTLNLAQATGLGRAMVAEVLPDRRHARALAYWDGQECRQGMEYLLEDAPCQRVMEQGEACFPDDVAELFPRDLALAANGIRGYFGARLESSEGTPLGVLVVMDRAPLRDRAEVASLVTIFAARAAAELERQRADEAKHAALERFEAIFQHTPNVAIQGYDAHHRLMHWNHASETMYGIAARDAIGRDTRSLLGHSPETAARLETAIDAVFKSGVAAEPEEWRFLIQGGREIWVLSTLFPVTSGGAVVEVFFMDVDITELKHANASVNRLIVELEARVAERTAELAELNRELEAFSYSVSHDLRAPLRSIEGFGRLLEQDYADRLDAVGLDYIGRMTRSAKRLALLIDDLLELTRIERARIRPADVDLGALADEIVEELRHGAPQRHVEVAIAAGMLARGDSQLLRIALQNLIENAWKYTGRTAGARIAFGCEICAEGPVYHVRDNGAGFDMAYADKLFAPFQRLHNVQEFEGSGVGLATVARVLRRHNGRIWAEASPGQGATFYFTLG